MNIVGAISARERVPLSGKATGQDLWFAHDRTCVQAP